MKLPESIKIGGHTVKVICPYEFKERVDIDGQYDHELKEIRLSEVDAGGNKKATGVIMVTFIHEFLHAVDYCSGHKIFVNNEPAIEGISEGIYQVLVDNGYLDAINSKG